MVTEKNFGFVQGSPVLLYTLTNGSGMQAQVSSYGCTLVSLQVPDRSGTLRETILGYEDPAGYASCEDYLGATVGRFGNRIAEGRFTLGGTEYQLTCNDGRHSLHGGSGGISRKLWQGEICGEALRLTCRCADGEDGYPGGLEICVTVSLDEENGLHLQYRAVSDADTICNLTNHAYFNFLGGFGTVLEHELYLRAERYTAVDEELISVADVPVAGTAFDFRSPRPIGQAIYDHNFPFSPGDGPQATLWEKSTGIFMEVFTDRPGVQVYASCTLPRHKGRGGADYGVGSGLCLETQLSPNAPNRPGYTGYLVRKGIPWETETVYRFSVK